MKLNKAIILGALVTTAAHAAVTVSEYGATAPTLNASTDTGYTGASNSEFSLDGGDTYGQSFQVPATGTVSKVYFAYRSFGNADGDGLVNFTLRLDVGNNGSYEINQAFTGVDKNNFNTTAGTSWIEFDLSSLDITLDAGTTHSVWWNSNNPASQWVCAPKYYNTTVAPTGPDAYTNGSILGTPVGGGTRDALFVVTTVPEPSAVLLGGLGLLGLLRRRRA